MCHDFHISIAINRYLYLRKMFWKNLIGKSWKLLGGIYSEILLKNSF